MVPKILVLFTTLGTPGAQKMVILGQLTTDSYLGHLSQYFKSGSVENCVGPKNGLIATPSLMIPLTMNLCFGQFFAESLIDRVKNAEKIFQQKMKPSNLVVIGSFIARVGVL